MIKGLLTYGFLICTLALFSQGSSKILTSYSGKVIDTKGINSDEMEFSAVVVNDKFYFASSREPDYVNIGENNWERHKKINVYQGKLNNTSEVYDLSFSDIKGFSEINNQFTHTGPISFSVTGDTMFFTQVLANSVHKLKKYKPQIYMKIKVNGRWNKSAYLLPFNNPLFSYGHPTFDSETKTLYFASDVEGGKGGKDIYYAQLKNNIWSAPINMSTINTSANELYPYFAEDKTLFFSSDRELGKGGLDVYFKTTSNQEITNLEFLNSEADDFGITLFNDEKMGLLSSNRNGTDDIFAFSIVKEMEFQNNLLGKFEYTKLEEDIARPLSVFLLDAEKEVVSETGVNEKGEFQFFDLERDEDYSVMANSKSEMNLQVYDADGNPGQRLIADQYGDFVFELLEMSDIGQLNLKQISKDGTAKIVGRFLYEENEFKETGILVVNLIDENGHIAHTVKSDKDGFFNFENLPADKDYIIELEKNNDDLTLLIFNEDMRIVEQLKKDANGHYLYRKMQVLNLTNIQEKSLLHEDEFVYNLGNISGNFNSNGREGYFPDGLKVGVYNKEGNFVEKLETDEAGKFDYPKQIGVEDYVFKIIEKPSYLDLNSITLIMDGNDGLPQQELKMGCQRRIQV